MNKNIVRDVIRIIRRINLGVDLSHKIFSIEAKAINNITANSINQNKPLISLLK